MNNSNLSRIHCNTPSVPSIFTCTCTYSYTLAMTLWKWCANTTEAVMGDNQEFNIVGSKLTHSVIHSVTAKTNNHHAYSYSTIIIIIFINSSSPYSLSPTTTTDHHRPPWTLIANKPSCSAAAIPCPVQHTTIIRAVAIIVHLRPFLQLQQVPVSVQADRRGCLLSFLPLPVVSSARIVAVANLS